MSARLTSMLHRPVMFAEAAPLAAEGEITLAAIDAALACGATGWAAKVWLTADGVPVIHPTGAVKGRLRPIPVRTLVFHELTSEVLSVESMYEHCQADIELSLEVGGSEQLAAVMSLPRQPTRLWIRGTDVAELGRWREAWPELRLVYATRRGQMSAGPERLGADLSAADIDGVCLPYPDWTGGLTTLFHRFEVLCLAHDAVHDRMFDDLLRMGVDAVYSPYVQRMMDAVGRA